MIVINENKNKEVEVDARDRGNGLYNLESDYKRA